LMPDMRGDQPTVELLISAFDGKSNN